ncbi:MAG: hypothetical protein ACKOBZ_03660 [Nitrospira sp.]
MVLVPVDGQSGVRSSILPFLLVGCLVGAQRSFPLSHPYTGRPIRGARESMLLSVGRGGHLMPMVYG